MWDAVAKEYDKVETEIAENFKMALTVSTGAMGATLTALGWLVAKPSSEAVIYLAPFVLAWPGIAAVRFSHCSMMRLGSYVLMFLEPVSPLQYETRNMQRSKLPWTQGRRKEPSYPLVVANFLASLALFDIVLLIARWGVIWEANRFWALATAWGSVIGMAFVVGELLMIRQNWCEGFREEWRAIRHKEAEEGEWDPDLPEK